MNSQLQAIPPHYAKIILGKYLEKFVRVIEKQRLDFKNLANLEVQLKDQKKQALDEIERNSLLKELEFGRRYS